MSINYERMEYKVQARKGLSLFYQKETKTKSIPEKKQYWTLCNIQSTSSKSEINQLSSMGLFKKSQFHGVDRSEEIIQENIINHPEAHWYHGEWDSVIRGNSRTFDPAVIYLDLTSMAKTEAVLRTVNATMNLCDVDTFIFINVMLNNPRDPKIHFHDDDFLNGFYASTFIEFNKNWHFFDKALHYNATGLTNMVTYPFRKIK